ncbi:MAG: triose-phosphate isomerase [Opitutales bacterium]|nr:triose-phosphate isomerase [Opitutales bacterium]
MARRYFIAGNWKMNKTSAEAAVLAKAVAQSVGGVSEVDIAICPTFTSLESAGREIKGTNVKLGAQNMYFEKSGAFTGEISADMLNGAGCEYVILGHSERRQYFKECDCLINKKVKAAVAASLKPILCVGETLEERESGKTIDVVSAQTKGGLDGLSAAEALNVVVAYEPVWAIGTGKTATPAMAQEVHAEIRKVLAGMFGADAAEKIQILYGGSMKPENADELLKQKDIDGGLIGGAALKADSFASLVKSAVALS